MKIANPLSLDYSIMRTELIGGLLGSTSTNFAKKNKDFALADKIRDDLKARGIVLEDTPDGVKWKIEK